ncbi:MULTISPECIES: hypothetical protein [unclassified Sphingobacterium]|uniref:hypothetical protein n=1 Tax=unclassified Sphingobacterium TaxID=2609468 RepID=UPI0029549949|nr:hypothetical protein [Sphingobacterium sp. UGAL515B_05]WON96855.1 hypothetical protein OK025_10695 [Sphingobacterium sp. UGAL515B_05]
MKRLLFIIPFVVFFLGCKKEKDDANPFLGEWEIKTIYTKYTDPVAGLKEETTDVKTFLAKNGYSPSTYKGMLFYAVDSAALITSEIFALPNDDGHLYEDPDKPDSESKTADRIRASYKVDGNTITLQLEPLPVSQKLTYRYAFVNGFLELTVKDLESELEGKPVIHKEVWTLQKSK